MTQKGITLIEVSGKYSEILREFSVQIEEVTGLVEGERSYTKYAKRIDKLHINEVQDRYGFKNGYTVVVTSKEEIPGAVQKIQNKILQDAEQIYRDIHETVSCYTLEEDYK